jgi:hypothetical protein
MSTVYPLGLRTILKAGKSRAMVPTFKTAEPRRGPSFVQKIGTDAPVFWDVTFSFDEVEREVFFAWFYSPTYCDRGVNDFTMPIKTEFGIVEHLCQFMPDSLMACSEAGEVFTYTAQIRARAIEFPSGTDLDAIVTGWLA